MASSDVDQKYLGRIADASAPIAPLVSKALYQLLGLSVVLAKKLYRARKLRKLDTSRDTKSLQLYHQIIWLSREGLSILELSVMPYAGNGELGAECQVLVTKLRASFHHIFCLFHNNPPITTVSAYSSKRSTSQPLSPKHDNGQRRRRGSSGGSPQEKRENNTPKRGSRESKGKRQTLRDNIDSITSDASFLTNPYAGVQPGTTPPPGLTPSMPPGFAPLPPKPSAFLLPAIDFVPNTATYFRAASNIATLRLPGAHPLRLSVAIEHAAFLWDCVHDHSGSRSLARRAIRSLRDGEDIGITDEQYDDAADMVGVLGRMMKRKSWEGTPKPGAETSPPSAEPPSATKPVTGDPFPQTYPPPAPEPTLTSDLTPATPSKKMNVYRDVETVPSGFDGSPGGTPSSPAQERRGSRGSRHTRTGSKSTGQTVTPRDRKTTRDRASSFGDGMAPVRDARRSPDLPPAPPPKDPSPSMRSTSKQSTPRRDAPAQISPRDRIPTTPQRPSRPSTSGRTPSTPLKYPRPMEVSPKYPGGRLQEATAASGYHTDEGYGDSS
ncbi:uncharacterized protein PV09_02569 [Verruconis gallopava]|uniref:14-3-3 domain-containing protein n=1 Tax=Verruconis gallopava TaxID=253628 RepID=A0A0D2B6N2_9PEZI|nr:uncharacterized protein PV09_02569 [Verruconis gallopava]KIW06899.1 hypothetical protein PV09_02569 [Verruconis gallopava]